jgi:hypothetical protein
MMQLKRMILVGITAVAPLGIDARVEAQTLHGSRSSVELMYSAAVAKDLPFFQTPDAVYQAAIAGKLKLVSFTNDVALDEVHYPFVLPQTLELVTRLAAQYRAACGERLVVTSGARPTDKQPRNSVAESVHPTGMAVDFHRPVEPCLSWLRQALIELEDEHVIEATEERRPPHFHVAVLRPSPSNYAVHVPSKSLPLRAVASNGEVTKGDTAAAIEANPVAARGVVDSRGSDDSSGPKSYRVQAGDNLWTIARQHHTTVERLQKENKLRSLILKPGQKLRIP